MIKRNNYEVVCKFCGESRTVTVIDDDHVDMDGRNWIKPTSKKEDYGCSCEFGKLEKKMDTPKEMCINCEFYDSDYCTNKDEIKDVANKITQFDFNFEKLKVTKPLMKCNHYKLNYNIFESLFIKEP